MREAYEPYIERIGMRPGPLLSDYRRIVEEGRASVVKRDGRVVGLLITSVHPDHLLVENIAVSRQERGTGLGAFLLDLAEDQARRAGLPEVRLYTHEKMTENLAYYPRRGFRETGRREEHGFARVFFARAVVDRPVRSCASRQGGRRCTKKAGHAGLHRNQGRLWSELGADPLHCPGSGEPGTSAETLPDGFPDGRALCSHCLRFIALDPAGRLVDHDTSDPHETDSEIEHVREWMNTHGW